MSSGFKNLVLLIFNSNGSFLEVDIVVVKMGHIDFRSGHLILNEVDFFAKLLASESYGMYVKINDYFGAFFLQNSSMLFSSTKFYLFPLFYNKIEPSELPTVNYPSVKAFIFSAA